MVAKCLAPTLRPPKHYTLATKALSCHFLRMCTRKIADKTTTMRKKVIIIYLLLVSACWLNGQESRPGNQNFPLGITLEFHSFNVPFKEMLANFSNIGIGIGTELYFNNNPEWGQRFSLIWIRNKEVGNGLLLYSQAFWRPTITGDAFGELKGGLGYMLGRRPVESFQKVNGEWKSVGKRGKGMLTIPLGLGLGVHSFTDDRQFTHQLGYQFLVLNNYNASVPIVPETLIQVGTSTHF